MSIPEPNCKYKTMVTNQGSNFVWLCDRSYALLGTRAVEVLKLERFSAWVEQNTPAWRGIKNDFTSAVMLMPGNGERA